jgi:hypothetical protein
MPTKAWLNSSPWQRTSGSRLSCRSRKFDPLRIMPTSRKAGRLKTGVLFCGVLMEIFNQQFLEGSRQRHAARENCTRWHPSLRQPSRRIRNRP